MRAASTITFGSTNSSGSSPAIRSSSAAKISAATSGVGPPELPRPFKFWFCHCRCRFCCFCHRVNPFLPLLCFAAQCFPVRRPALLAIPANAILCAAIRRDPLRSSAVHCGAFLPLLYPALLSTSVRSCSLAAHCPAIPSAPADALPDITFPSNAMLYVALPSEFTPLLCIPLHSCHYVALLAAAALCTSMRCSPKPCLTIRSCRCDASHYGALLCPSDPVRCYPLLPFHSRALACYPLLGRPRLCVPADAILCTPVRAWASRCNPAPYSAASRKACAAGHS